MILNQNNKKLKCLLKFNLPSKEASLSNIPTLSPRLGQVGVNADGFCTVFNEECGTNLPSNVIIKVEILVYEDRSYEIIEKGILYSSLLTLFLKGGNKIYIRDLFILLNLILFFEKLDPIKNQQRAGHILKSLKNGIFSRNYEIINDLD